MRVFISCDIEGVATTTLWDETRTLTQPALAAAHARQMTAEVKAACEGAIAAGAKYILVKDAHGSGTNIDVSELPECVEVQRGWSGHPYGMVQGIEAGFDAAMFIGYHNAAGRDGNPLSHTMTGAPMWVKVNGMKMSEFMLYSWAAALENVPTVLLTGDQQLCEDSIGFHPALKVLPVKQGFGGATRAPVPSVIVKRIRNLAEEVLYQPHLSQCVGVLPSRYVVDICYRDHVKAKKMSYYPGFVLTDETTIRMKTRRYFDVLRALQFVL